MFFDEIYNPVSRERSLTESEMKQARMDRWGVDNPYSVTENGGELKGKMLPGFERELGWFEGIGDAWKGLNAAAYETGSSVLTILSNTSIGTEQERQGWRNYAKQLRANSKNNWEADPETMGAATQIIHGFWKMMPKAIGYGMALGPAGGALAYGADVGIQETQRLKDEGVDEKTAINAGMLKFATSSIGLRLPAEYGSTRIGSAVYGAGINLVTEGIERKGIQFILENQNYDEIAKQYDLSWTDMAISAGLGAAFGAVTWRSPESIRREKMAKRLPDIEKAYREKLKEKGFTEEEVEAQVKLNANSAAALLAKAGKLDMTDEQLAKILIEDGGAPSGEVLTMPVTQGKTWIYGDRATRNPDKKVRVTEASAVKADGRISDSVKAELDKYKIDSAKRLSKNDAAKFLKNDDTGWILTINGGDKAEIVSAATKRGDRLANLAAIFNLRELVKNAFLAESYRDIKAAQGVKGADLSLKGIHRLYAPMRLNGEDYLVKLTVKDKSGNPRDQGLAMDDRTALYQLVSIEVNKSKSAQSITSERGNEVGTLTADGTSRPQPEGLSRTSQQRRPHGEPSSEISVREMLTGVNRDGDVRFIDGEKDDASRSMFFVNEPNTWALEEGGSYYNTPEDMAAWENAEEGRLYQRTIKIKSSSDDFDPNWRPLRRTAENMTPEEKAVFDEYIDSRPDAIRIKANFARLKDTPWERQAREAVFVHSALNDLLAGREPRVQSMLDHPQLRRIRADLKKGEDGLWFTLERTRMIGNASKPANNVNSSFLSCDPSNDCAKFCYATEGNYRNAAVVVKSELITEAIRRDPIRAADITTRNYMGTAEYHMKKALRLFDKGDGDNTWIPYIKKMNENGIRVQIFSKRPDFLRQVSDYNVKLLSIDESNKAMADQNPDLKVAFVYSNTSQIEDILRLHKRGQLQVILPVKQGVKLLDEAKVNELISRDKTLKKITCLIDAGWKTLPNAKKGPQKTDWNCTMCDKSGGFGCFHGQSTERMNYAAKNDAELLAIDVDKMSLKQLAEKIRNVQKELKDATGRLEENLNASEGGDAESKSVAGNVYRERVSNISSGLDDLLEELLSRINGRAADDGFGRSAGQPAGAVRGGTGARAGELDNPAGGGDGKLYQRGSAGTQQSDGQGTTAESGSAFGKLKQIGQNLFQLAYHGSPHVFDRFTLDHIGSGEGAQAHGWGLYFALEKFVAVEYRERLTGDKDHWAVNRLRDFSRQLRGKFEGRNINLNDIRNLYAMMSTGSLPDVIDMPRMYGLTANEVKAKLGDLSREEASDRAFALDFVIDELEDMNVYDDFMENVETLRPEVRDYVKKVVLKGETWESTRGRLYTVDIPEDDVMMREDASLSEQPEIVQRAVKKLLGISVNRKTSDKADAFVSSMVDKEVAEYFPEVSDLLKETAEKLRSKYVPGGKSYIGNIHELDVGPIKAEFDDRLNKIFENVKRKETDEELTFDPFNPLAGFEFEDDVGTTPSVRAENPEEVKLRIKDRFVYDKDKIFDQLSQASYDDFMSDFRENIRINDRYDGDMILRAVERKYGSPKAAAIAFNNEGVKGIRYYGSRDGECAVVWSEDAIQMREILEQNGGDVRGWYDIKSNTIHLTPKADISTFSHEHAHWYMVKLFQFAGEKGMNAEVVDDAEKLLNAFGISSLDDWNALSFEEQRKYHERFGAWTEIYLSKGKSPVKGLEGVFERLGEWLLDLYHSAVYGAKTAEEAVGGRYKREFGEDLPPLSSEVKACLDRMYGAEKRSRMVVPTGVQAAAARIAQTQRVNDQKVVAPMKNPRDPDVYRAAINAQRDAAESLNSGEKVDVSEAVRGQQINDEAISDGRRTFTRAVYVDGNSDTIVTLQNRNRDTPASQMQMNNIAGSPEYGRLSISRTTDSGAPIVSFGEFPAYEFVGVTGYVMDGGQKVPVTYAVVEADSVQTSNFIDGRQNPNYAKDFSQMQAVAGNGRMTGLQEAFNRNSADQYVKDLIDDYQQHGVDPEAIRKLKKPVLVRIMPKEKVSSGFVDRSNQSQVLDMSGAEQAVRDSEKLAGRKIAEYEFDKNGEPTSGALKNFLSDIGEPTALGSMTDANGYPTLPARNRIKAAVFYYAYRDPELTALAFDEMDKQGIKRILNAMMVFAPHVIDIRRASNGAIDIGPLMTEAVNMIRSGRKMDNDILITEDNAAANPGVRQFMELFSENRDSAAAITRITDRFANDLMTSLGEGSTLLGDPLDTADALSYLRRAQNALIAEDREKGGKGVDLPDIDVAAVRETMKAMKAAERPAEQVVQAMAETAAEKAAMDAGVKTDAVNTDTVDVTSHGRAQAVFTDDADRVRVENLSSEKPDQTYLVVNDEGREVEMTAAEVLEHQQKIEENAKTDADGMGKATECIIRNGGIE